MLESLWGEVFEYKKLTPEEQQKRGILGRLVGIIADFKNPTRNGRLYSEKLWDKVFNDPIMKEKMANRCCFGELGHPEDRTEVDMTKIAICLAEQPKKDRNGRLQGVFDILDTPNGRILKTLCDYGCNIGVSSRGEGDLITNYKGDEEVDPDTYYCEAWDAVIIPAVQSARPKYVTESLNLNSVNMRKALCESYNKASEDDKLIMKETLNKLNIKLTEEQINGYEVQTTESGTIVRDSKGNVVQEFPTDEEAYEFVKDMNEKLEAIRQLNKEDTDATVEGDVEVQPENMYIVVYNIYDKDNEFVEDHMEKITADSLEEAKEKFAQKIDEDIDKDEQHIQDAEWFQSENSEEEQLPDYIHIYDFSDEESVEKYFDEMPELLDQIEFESDEDQELIDKASECRDRLDEIIPTIPGENPVNIDADAENDKADDDGLELVEQLQDALKCKSNVERQLTQLQEKLSVCYTKEAEYKELAIKQSQTIQKLKESKDEIANLHQKISKLQDLVKQTREVKNEQLNASKSLQESVKSKNEELQKLSESIKEKDNNINDLSDKLTKSYSNNKKLKEQVALITKTSEEDKEKLNEALASVQNDLLVKTDEWSQKLKNQQAQTSKYKKLARTAVDKYISAQSSMIGVSSNEIKSRLGESYTFEDIDAVCQDLRSYKVNMSKLPFNVNLNNKARINFSESYHDRLTPENDDDIVDEQLLRIAQLD